MSAPALVAVAPGEAWGGRVPPQDVLAERSVLGAMLLSPAAIADVVEVLSGKDFYRPAHAVIFDAVLGLFGKGEPADAVTVADELGVMGELSRVGGAVYLHTLISTVPTAANASYYAQIVAEKATLRNLVMAGDRISQLGYGADARGEAGSGSVAEVVDRAQAELYSVGEDRHRADVVEVGDLLQSTLGQVEALGSTGGVVEGLVATGLADLDERLAGGLLPGQLAVMAGRPGSGKSSLALGMAAHAALHAHTPAVVFSLEMGRLELMLRLLSATGSIPLRSLRTGQVSDQHWARLAHCSQQLAGAPLYLDDSPNLTVTEIRAKARRLKQRHGLGLVVVDYLQLMSSGQRVESRQVEVAGFSRAMKLLAMELEVPVIALSQLNRGPEQRSDKKPMLSDLRESGGLENDADLVLLVHREDLYDPDTPRAGEADLIVAKQRNGPTGTVPVSWQATMSRFVDLAR